MRQCLGAVLDIRAIGIPAHAAMGGYPAVHGLEIKPTVIDKRAVPFDDAYVKAIEELCADVTALY